MMNSVFYYAASAFFNGLIALFMVYYVYLRNKKNPLNRSFLYVGISIGGWSLIYSLWALAGNAKTAEMCVHLHMTFATFIPAAIFYFTCRFTENQIKLRKWIYIATALGAFYSISALLPTNLLIAGVGKVLFFEYWPKPGVLLLSHVCYFAFFVFFSFCLLIEKYQKAHGQLKRQVLLVLLAYLVGFGGGSINWLLWFGILVPPVTHLFVGIMFMIIAYAMIRYGLMDTDILIEVMRNSRALMMGLVAASINHELRNPLYIAKGKVEAYLEMAKRGCFKTPEEKDRKTMESMSEVYAQLERAMNIIQRLSALVKPAVSKKEIVRIDLEELVNSVLELVASEHRTQNIVIVKENLAGFELLANRGHMEEIFFNLIVNACQAMEKTGGELKISAAVNGKGEKLIRVSDAGPGIPEEKLYQIFDPFVSGKEKGSGLGLYIVKLLTEKNNGRIFVESEVGKGTTFVLEFSRTSS